STTSCITANWLTFIATMTLNSQKPWHWPARKWRAAKTSTPMTSWPGPCIRTTGLKRRSPPWTEALKLGTRDARLLFHAGMIHQRLGNTAQARDYLRRALATNPHFHIIYADLAMQTLK